MLCKIANMQQLTCTNVQPGQVKMRAAECTSLLLTCDDGCGQLGKLLAGQLDCLQWVLADDTGELCICSKLHSNAACAVWGLSRLDGDVHRLALPVYGEGHGLLWVDPAARGQHLSANMAQ